MALHNVDRSSMDRSNPAPNSHDMSSLTGVPMVNVPRPAHNTLSVAYISPGVVPSTQSGNAGTGTSYGRIGQFVQTGTMGCVYNSSLENVFSVPHGLGYAPLVIAVLNNATVTGISDNGTTSIMLPTHLNASLANGYYEVFQWIYMMSDDTNVYCYCINANGGTGSFDVTYYLYQQPALQL